MSYIYYTWIPFLYLYGIGGIFFISGLYIVKKSGGYNPDNKRHKYWWRVTIFGFFYFMLFHLILILAAILF
jgi:hypothetical protein